MENKIIVYYISINGVENIPEYVAKVMSKITTSSALEDTEIITVPVYGDSRVECINPKYITDNELIKSHERLMSELHEKLKNQIDQM